MKEHQENQYPGSSSGGKKLMKLADFEDDDEDQKEGEKELNTNKKKTDEGEVKSHQRIVCPICNKTFSSGKAFGGHKSSAHVQSKGQKSCSKKLIKRKYNNNNNNSAKSVVGDDDFIDEDGDYYYYSERLIEKTGLNKMRKIGITCHHCEKDFPSKKALFGHMRCHPDRPYRGMEAPDSSNLNDDDVDIENSPIISHDGKCESVEEVEEEEADEINQENDMGVGTSEVAKATKVVDLAQDLVGVGWFRKGRRGGGDETVANSSSSAMMDNKSDSISNNQIYQHCSDDSFEECRLASHLLMYLHNSGGSKSNPDEERVAESIPMASQSEGMELFLDFAMSKKTVEKSEQSSNEEAEVAGVINQLKKNKGKSTAILENGLDDNDNNSSDDNNTDSDDELVRKKLDYARKGKGISLGKKKRISKCNNDKKVIIKWNKLSSSSAGDNVDYHDISPPSAAAPPPPPHSATENGKEFRCSSCGKTFPTHQALGGHKSSHNKFRMNIHNTIDDEVLPTGSSSRTVVRHSQKNNNNNEDIKNMICDESPSSKGRRISKRRKKAAVEVQKMLDFDLNQLPEEDCSHADDESCM